MTTTTIPTLNAQHNYRTMVVCERMQGWTYAGWTNGSQGIEVYMILNEWMYRVNDNDTIDEIGPIKPVAIDKSEVDRLTSIIGPLADDGAYFFIRLPGTDGHDSNCPYDVWVWAPQDSLWNGMLLGAGTPELFTAFQTLCIDVAGIYVDSSANHVHRENTGFVTQHGEEVYVHLLLAEHGEHGYLAYPEGGVIRWFGTGEKFPSYLAILQEYRKNGWLITEDQWQEMARS